MTERIEAFANFGFAESHSISFALLVYASTWLRLHYPAAFLAALLRAQPMGFYSPLSLVADARRHGVEVRRTDMLKSGIHAVLEPLDAAADVVAMGNDSCLRKEQPEVAKFDPEQPFDSDLHRRDGRFVVWLGLSEVKSIGLPAPTWTARASCGPTSWPVPAPGRWSGECHPPPAPRHRGRRHLPQPGGRDRHDQRHLLGRRLCPE